MKMVASRRIIFKKLAISCHLKTKNKITPKAKKNPLRLLAKNRERIKKRAKTSKKLKVRSQDLVGANH